MGQLMSVRISAHIALLGNFLFFFQNLNSYSLLQMFIATFLFPFSQHWGLGIQQAPGIYLKSWIKKPKFFKFVSLTISRGDNV